MNKVNNVGQLYLKLRLISFFTLLFFNLSFASSDEIISRRTSTLGASSLMSGQPSINSATLSGTTLTINFAAPATGGTPTSYEFSTTGTSPWTIFSVSGTSPNLVGTVTGLSPTLTEFYIRAVYGSTQTVLNTYAKAMTSAWSQNLPATDPAKAYKMVVSGTWGIANGRAHRDAAYDVGSTNTIGVSGTPGANRGCDSNWLFEGVCPPPVPTSPAGYAIDNTYEYAIGPGKTAGYTISFSDGGYGDNTGTLTYRLFETTSTTFGTSVRGTISGGSPSVPGTPSISTSTLSGSTLTINFAAPSSGGAPTSYQFSLEGTPGGSWSTLSYTPSGANLVGTVNSFSGSVFYIRAVNGSGSGAPSQGSVSGGSNVGAPGAPTINTATLSSGTLTINFMAPASSGNSSITAYEYSITGPSGSWLPVTVANLPDLNLSGTGTVSGFTGAVNTSILLRARNTQGGGTASTMGMVSEGSNVGAPGAPTINTATLSSGTLTINLWLLRPKGIHP